MPTATATPIEERAEAVERADKAFGRRDYEAFYAALEDISRAAFEMGRAKGKYIPLFKEPPTPKPEPKPPKGGVWTVGEFPAENLRGKQGQTIYTVQKEDGQIVAFCDNRDNADLIARALGAYDGE